MKLITIRNCWNCKAMLSKPTYLRLFSKLSGHRNMVIVPISNPEMCPPLSAFSLLESFCLWPPDTVSASTKNRLCTKSGVWGRVIGFRWNFGWRVCNLLCVMSKKNEMLKGTSCFQEIYTILLKGEAYDWRLEHLSYFIPTKHQQPPIMSTGNAKTPLSNPILVDWQEVPQ